MSDIVLEIIPQAIDLEIVTPHPFGMELRPVVAEGPRRFCGCSTKNCGRRGKTQEGNAEQSSCDMPHHSAPDATVTRMHSKRKTNTFTTGHFFNSAVTSDGSAQLVTAPSEAEDTWRAYF